MDETTAPVLNYGRGEVKKGFFWAIACDDRGHDGQGPPIVLFHYAYRIALDGPSLRKTGTDHDGASR